MTAGELKRLLALCSDDMPIHLSVDGVDRKGTVIDVLTVSAGHPWGEPYVRLVVGRDDL